MSGFGGQLRELDPAELDERLAAPTERLLLLYLWGPDCPNCEIFKRSLPRLLPELARLPVDFVALDAYAHPEVARRFAVYGIPHFLLFNAGKKLGKMSEFRGEAYFLSVVREQAAKAAACRGGPVHRDEI
jgi:thioredoxin 1